MRSPTLLIIQKRPANETLPCSCCPYPPVPRSRAHHEASRVLTRDRAVLRIAQLGYCAAFLPQQQQKRHTGRNGSSSPDCEMARACVCAKQVRYCTVRERWITPCGRQASKLRAQRDSSVGRVKEGLIGDQGRRKKEWQIPFDDERGNYEAKRMAWLAGDDGEREGVYLSVPCCISPGNKDRREFGNNVSLFGGGKILDLGLRTGRVRT